MQTLLFFENENEGREDFPPFAFDCRETAQRVAAAVLEDAHCPYDAEVSLTLSDDVMLREVNLAERGIDAPTDVLSFPAVAYGTPGDFREAEADRAGSFDPENGFLLLGDILISADRVRNQAEAYGHSERREFAFLVAHSMLHLIGYDHIDEKEAEQMFAIQERILEALRITREDQ